MGVGGERGEKAYNVKLTEEKEACGQVDMMKILM